MQGLARLVAIAALATTWGVAAEAAHAAADLVPRIADEGAFTVGTQRTIRVDVRNDGPEPTSQEVRATVTVDDGLDVVAYAGDTWDCAGDQVLSCTSATPTPSGQDLETLEVDVDVGAAATPSATVTVDVASAEEADGSDNRASAEIPVRHARDLSAHILRRELTVVGGATTVIGIDVRNDGARSTDGPTVLSGSVPDGFSLESAEGEGWACEGTTAWTCTSSAVVRTGRTFSDVRLRVWAAKQPTPPTTFAASVTSPDDDTGDNTATAVVTVRYDSDSSLSLTLPTLEVGKTARLVVEPTHSGVPAPEAPTVRVVVPGQLEVKRVYSAEWRCSLGATVMCTRSGTRSNVRTILIDVLAKSAATAAPLTAAVEVPDDVNPANNTVTAALVIAPRPLVAYSVRLGLTAGRRTLLMRVGDTVRLRVPTARKRAQRWRLAGRHGALKLVRRRGSLLTFRATRPGRANLRFTRRGAKQRVRFTVSVTVRE